MKRAMPRQYHNPIPSRVPRLLATLCLCSVLGACKIAVEVPEGGTVVSESGAYNCSAGDVCTISVNDVFFDETFRAVAAEGYFFSKWEKKPGSFCGGSINPCFLSTTGFVGDQGLLDILESNQTFYLTPVFEKIPQIMAEDITTEGEKIPTKEGFEIAGTLVIRHPDNYDQIFEDADLDVQVNDDGEVSSMTGTAVLPNLLVENVALENKLRAEIGYRTGEEINADKAIDINLRDERRYMVLLIDQELNITIADPGKPETAKKETISTPGSGKIIVIIDAADPMFYRYGETNLFGAIGEAQSAKGLLPYVPDIKHPGILPFDGHRYRTGKYGVGIKLVDLLELEGEMVVHEPNFTRVDFAKPFKPLEQYRAGFNGAAKLVLSVAGFGFFELEVAKASAMFNANPKRGKLKLTTQVEARDNPLPDWMPIQASGPMIADFNAGSSGNPLLTLGGSFESSMPRAALEGKIRVTPDSLTLKGTVVDPRITVPVDVTFRDQETRARVGINVDFSDEIGDRVTEEFDKVLEEIESAKGRLEEAIADYEFELSLRGLRALLPGISDGVSAELNRVPGIVYSTVRSTVRKEIDKRNVCPLGICVVSKRLRDSIATSAAEKGRDRAKSEIRPYLDLMKELKTLAGEASNEQLLAALESALREAYSKRRFRKNIEYKVGVPKLFTRTFTYTIDEKILDDATAARILEAANNIHLIPETSNIVISGQRILDELPDEEIVARTREELERGVRKVPGVSEVRYIVKGRDYQAWVKFSDGREFQVDFNVLDPDEATRGISNLIADQLLGGGR